ncbi:major facilitator superfamily domain-containing protein [Fennellomyces sp. T-0311]|nr:major facilitator superfamily domain-containing protein [Fennellomyces sp. T-0311]
MSIKQEDIKKSESHSRIADHECCTDNESGSLEELDAQLPPDGGYGWFVTLGAFLASLLGGALPFCWYLKRIMQDYYQREVFGSSASSTVQLSSAGTLTTGMIYLLSYPTTVAYSILGAKVTLFIGTLVASGGLIAAGAATEIWHLYLSMSICSGIGISILFNVSNQVLAYWFDKKKTAAFGFIGSAQPFAGLVVPFIITPINSNLGASWTFRILGLAFLVTNIIACILIKETKSGIQCRRKTKLLQFNCRTVLETNIILYAIQAPVQIGSMYIATTFLPSYATYIGLSDTQESAIISLICGMGFLGRVGAGLLAGRFGRLNILILSSTISGLSSCLIWMFAYDIKSLMGFSAVFGLCMGTFPATAPPTTAFLAGMNRYPIALAVVITACSLGCLGSTIASAIESISSAEPFLTYKLMTGCGYLFCTIILLILRLRLDRNIFSKI